MSAFGGIVGLNRPIDVETATALTSTFIEAVIAPSVADEARAILATKANLRVVTADFARWRCDAMAGGCTEVRSILGGILTQDRAIASIEAREPWPRRRHAPTSVDEARADGRGVDGAALRVARVRARQVEHDHLHRRGSHARGRRGADEPRRCGEGRGDEGGAPDRCTGPWSASDAFFPFRDGLDAVADAGATAVVQPGGSVRDAEVIAAADEHGLAMVFTGRRHFRH